MISTEPKNLNISHTNQVYEVSRKHCGKLVLGVIQTPSKKQKTLLIFNHKDAI